MTEAVKKIKAGLKASKRSYVWLADEIGTSKQVLNSWMNHGIVPSDEYKLKLKKMFGLKDDWV